MTRTISSLTGLLLVTAVACVGITQRSERAGVVLPTFSDTAVKMVGMPMTLGEDELRVLGRPSYTARVWTDSRGVRIEALATVLESGGNVHDSRLCALHAGFVQERELPMQVAGRTMKAAVLKKDGLRALMLGWYVQGDGQVEPLEPMDRYSAQRWAAVKSLWSTLRTGKRTVMIRLTAPLPSDSSGDSVVVEEMSRVAEALVR